MKPVLIETWHVDAHTSLGYACLNAPKSLNALSLDMIQMLTKQLEIWQHDKGIRCVILDGQGEKAFCAGGDVRHLYHTARQENAQSEQEIADFFTQEYHLDYMIHNYPKPIVVWGDGIVMGGGLGLMAGASHRIATERTRIAMPEVTIGLYPDVGGSYFLNQMPGKLGLFLGLTGYRMQAMDAMHVGLVDTILASEQKSTLFQALKNIEWDDTGFTDQELVTRAVEHIQDRVLDMQSPLALYQNEIQALMQGNLSEIEQRMQNLQTEHRWLLQAQKNMQLGSPLSKALVWYQHQLGQKMTLADALQLELVMSVNCCMRGDFVEGVRALLIDKDDAPKWQSFQGVDAMLKKPWQENPLAVLNA